MSQQAKAKRQPLRKAALKKAEKRVRNESDQQASSKKQRPESKGRNTAEDSDEESDGDEEEDQELKNVNTQEYTFEFNDMKEDYSPGIKLILAATLVANPSKAYNLSDEIVKQGKHKQNTFFSCILHMHGFQYSQFQHFICRYRWYNRCL